MTQTNAERQRQWRERQKQAGYRQTVVWLPQEAVDILASYPEKERGQVILNALRNVTSITPITTPGNILITSPGNEKADTGPPALLNRFEVLEDKVERLTQAVQELVTSNTPITTPGNIPITTPGNDTHHAAKAKALSAEELAQAAQSLLKQGLSYAQIAERWENEKIPTLRGGSWHKGTIGKLVQRHQRR
jgi:hypothetical protein